MARLLELCGDFPELDLAPGEVVLAENESSNRLIVLSEGAMEVYRDDVTIALVTEPSSIFGEMSLLLGIPHTANVRAVAPSKVRVIDDALEHLRDNPGLVLPIAQLLARRLQSANSYLVDIKKQFADRRDHFAMVDQVLESLSNQQDEEFTPSGELPSEPSSPAIPGAR